MAVEETMMATSAMAAIAAPTITFIEPVLVIAALVSVGVVKREMGGIMGRVMGGIMGRVMGGVAIGVLEITGCEHSTASACKKCHV